MAVLSKDVPALEIKDLAIGYDGRTVLENLNFTVKRGEIFAIMGGNLIIPQRL